MHSEKRHQLRLNLAGFFIETSCLPLMILLVVGFMLLFFGSIYLQIKIVSIVLTIATRELGIDFRLGIALLIIAVFCFWIHIPLYLVMSSQSTQLRFYELFPVWFLKQRNVAYRQQFQPHFCVALNLVGGLIPALVAFYQFGRNSPISMLAVTLIVATVSYLFATVIPGRGICFRWHQLWILVIVAALSALQMAQLTDGSAAALAFSGSVLGTLIGADLLHLREAQKKAFGRALSIGGAGLKDGIVRCGLTALVLAEWIPYGVDFFTQR